MNETKPDMINGANDCGMPCTRFLLFNFPRQTVKLFYSAYIYTGNLFYLYKKIIFYEI